jgi:hypothetical protein
MLAWAGIYYSSLSGLRTSGNPFQQRQRFFLLLNCAICVSISFCFFFMVVVSDGATKKLLFYIGTSFVSAVNITAGAGFLLFGTLLYRSLTKDFVSAHATRLLAIAIAFSLSFIISSALNALPVVASQWTENNFVAYNSLSTASDVTHH